jgi:hypothetical protein
MKPKLLDACIAFRLIKTELNIDKASLCPRTWNLKISLPRLAVLKQYWKVSMAALLKRAADLNKITVRQQKYLWTKMSKQGFRLYEPVEIPPEEPTVLNDIIDVHRMQHGYSVVDLASLVSCFPDEFCETFLPASSVKLRIVS